MTDNSMVSHTPPRSNFKLIQPCDVAGQEDYTWINFLNNWVMMRKTSGFFDGLSTKWRLN